MKTTLLFLLTALAVTGYAFDQEQKPVVDLRGTWKFEIGDSLKYADPKFDDSKWDDIFVPESWENEGYPGYDGFAWYRKKFTVPLSAKGKRLHFNGGFIDDACTIYINGHVIGGKGKFPPRFETAYDQEEDFVLPQEYLNFNKENIVAIRIYDDYKFGGITRGKPGIFVHTDELQTLLQLPDLWKFKTGDDEQWSNPSFDDRKWQDLIVPTPWDYQGYGEYDGFGWYRVSFTVPSSLRNEKLYVVLGKIDDVDEAYFNGVKIGNTGRIGGSRWKENISEEYQVIRIYRIPSSAVAYDQKNVIALRVFDKMKFGGICEGPIGIISESEYKRNPLDKQKFEFQRQRTTFERILDQIFNDN